MKNLLLQAMANYPVISSHLEQFRPSPFDGIADNNLRIVLTSAAQNIPAVGQAVRAEKAAKNQVAINFRSQVAAADSAIHSLDDLRPSKQYTHSGQVSLS